MQSPECILRTIFLLINKERERISKREDDREESEIRETKMS